jgi:hypothetical protein
MAAWATTECSEYTIGVDVDVNAVSEARRIPGLYNIFAGGIASADAVEAIRFEAGNLITDD